MKDFHLPHESKNNTKSNSGFDSAAGIINEVHNIVFRLKAAKTITANPISSVMA